MKTLIAIKSCNRDLLNGCHHAIRETWGKDLPRTADLRFFVGEGDALLQDDEIRVDVVDDLVHLPIKVREMAKWSVQNGYDYSFFCDVDTFVIPSRLMMCGFESYDYLGRFMEEGPARQIPEFNDGRLGVIPNVWNYASGGVGYFLSQRATKLISEMVPAHYAEDFSVGQVLGPHIATGELKVVYPPKFDGYAAWHYCTWGRTGYDWPKSVGFNPSWMRESYRKGQP